MSYINFAFLVSIPTACTIADKTIVFFKKFASHILSHTCIDVSYPQLFICNPSPDSVFKKWINSQYNHWIRTTVKPEQKCCVQNTQILYAAFGVLSTYFKWPQTEQTISISTTFLSSRPCLYLLGFFDVQPI